MLGALGGRAPELMTVERGAFRTRTSIGSRWQRRFRWPEMRAVLAPGSGGDVETWIASPPDAGGAALPTVVDIHGGPLGAWAPAPSIEVMLLVDRGFRVLLPNIRGSATYGRAWIRESLGDWGGVDARGRPRGDRPRRGGWASSTRARLGVLGPELRRLHGPLADRHVGPVPRGGLRERRREPGLGLGELRQRRRVQPGGVASATRSRAEGVEKLWRQSPLRHVASIRTPLLMLQAGADQRCPPADNEQLFTALRVLGREVEYVLYPDESHVYQATGRPGPPDRPDGRGCSPGSSGTCSGLRATAAHGRRRQRRLSSGEPAVSWRVAARVAGERRATERRGSEPRRRRLGEERHEEARVERVAGAGRVGRGHRRRRDVEPERGRVAAGEEPSPRLRRA